jgi:hypothetical protein
MDIQDKHLQGGIRLEHLNFKVMIASLFLTFPALTFFAALFFAALIKNSKA